MGVLLLLYLLLLTGGIFLLLRGLYLTRLTWRSDIEPFSIRTPGFQVMLHPERFAGPERLGEIRAFNTSGAACILGAVVTFSYDIALGFERLS
jgi:hypothetical protein